MRSLIKSSAAVFALLAFGTLATMPLEAQPLKQRRHVAGQGDRPSFLPLCAAELHGDALRASTPPLQPRLLPLQVGGGADGRVRAVLQKRDQ